MRAKMRHLRGGFAFGEDHLGHSGAQRAVMIEFGETEIFKGQSAQALQRVGHAVRPSRTSVNRPSI